jgi:LPS O-antigen subunit length determinant protein (WzzB/FepE family)
MSGFISIIGVIYSLLLPNIYQSQALLVPVNPSSVPGTLRNISAFAGLAGGSLPTDSDDGNSLKATQKISTLSFFKNNILENINLQDLMAVKSWDPKTNTLVYDQSIYNSMNDTWVKDDFGQQQIPTAQKSFRVFIGNHLSFGIDTKTGFSNLSIRHQSPYIAKQWAELVIDEVNSHYRQKDRLESEKAVNYLNQQISMTSLSEIKQVLAQLLQEETKKLTLIEANQSYVFDYIDPPAVMELRVEPNRALICILIAIFGGMLSFLYVLIMHYVINKKD